MGMKSDFEAFVRSQKPGKKIDHDHGWDKCVLGQFAASIKRPLQEVVDILWHVYGVGKKGTDASMIVDIYPEIKRVPGKSVIDMLNEKRGKSTYADVVAMLG